ncbi:MAG: hypothetical protein FWD78_16590, partial [Treponema sp.]|nr:hypothetical protein [Treponema sp.]
MKKIKYVLFYSLLAIIMTFFLTTCQNPMFMDLPKIVVYEGWPGNNDPGRSYLEEYGVADWDQIPVNATNVKYWIDPTDNLLYINFNGNDFTFSDIKNSLYNNWNPNYEIPEGKEYIRGISYVVLSDNNSKNPPKYQITVEKDKGIYGLPDQDRMESFEVVNNNSGNNLPVPRNISAQDSPTGVKVSNVFDYKRRYNENKGIYEIVGYQLTIMIYHLDDPDYKQNVLNYLDSLTFAQSGFVFISRPGLYSYTGGSYVSIDFDTRSAPYYYEIDIYKDLEESDELGWPDIETLWKYGLYDFSQQMLDSIPATDITYQTVDYDMNNDPNYMGGKELILRFYGDKYGQAESVINTYLDNTTWKVEDVSTPLKLYTRGPINVTFDTTYKTNNYYEVYSYISPGTYTGWPFKTQEDDSKGLSATYGINDNENPNDWGEPTAEISSNYSTMWMIDPTSTRKPLYVWFMGKPGTLVNLQNQQSDYFNETW